MVDATPVHAWLVAQTRRRLARLPLAQATSLGCARVNRPAWSEPSPGTPGHGIDHLAARGDAVRRDLEVLQIVAGDLRERRRRDDTAPDRIPRLVHDDENHE